MTEERLAEIEARLKAAPYPFTFGSDGEEVIILHRGKRWEVRALIAHLVPDLRDLLAEVRRLRGVE